MVGNLSSLPSSPPRVRLLREARDSNRSPSGSAWWEPFLGLGLRFWPPCPLALMLPAGCAPRLTALLTQALEDCTEQKQKLQQNLMRCQALLRNWNSEAPENLNAEENKTAKPESETSAKDCEELELLNKALEKALRVRTKFQQPPPGRKEATQVAKRDPVAIASLKQQADPSKESTSKAAQVSSVSQKPGSSKKPTAYMLKAPYRTDPVVKRPQAKMSAALSSRLSKVPGRRRPPKGAVSPKAKLRGKTRQGPCENTCVTAQPGKQLGSCSAKPGRSSVDSMGGGDFAGADSPLAKAQRDCSSAPVESGALQSPAGGSTLGTTGPTSKTFTLGEKGSLLELPLPYRKAFTRYTRLLEKCGVCQTSPTAAAAKGHFMEKLQATFLSPSLAFSPAEVREELARIREVCSVVREGMDSEISASQGENPTWERQYESLLTVEGLQSIIKECLDKVHQLREAMESHSKLLPAGTACGEKCSSGCCASLGKQRCWEATTVGPPPLLVYSSLKELKEMEALKLNIARLHQQLEIQKAMEAELLPLLEPGRLPEGTEASLYRAISTLLCEGSETFPVLVKDEELFS
uniref:Tubulin epsilon and delta complex protein 2 isoform X1 n=2 Tax=Pogona vitticeps TaxID=103695 RepID=A0A6J0UV69_9SAUR